MSDEIVTTETSATPRAVIGGKSRAVLTEEFNPQTGATRRIASTKDGGAVEVLQDGGRGSPRLTATLAERIKALDAAEPNLEADDPDAPKDTVETVEPVAAEPAAEAAPAEGEPAAEVAPEQKPADPSPDLAAEHAKEVERYNAANRKLVADLEAARKQPKHTPSQRETALDKAERGYFDDSIGSIRQFIAATLGIEDPSAKEVDNELTGLYLDLTSKELGVPMDVAQQAQREAARTRQLLAREKRERKAETESKASEADTSDKQAKEAAEYIGTFLSTKRSDGKSIADEHPLLMKFSQRLHGKSPEALVNSIINEEVAVGRLDWSMKDDVLIKAAAKIIEDHYSGVGDEFIAAKKPTSTAKPTGEQPADAQQVSGKEQRQEPTAARTIKNADASVAPATPPAKKPATKETAPRFKSEAERRAFLIKKHIGES